MAPKATQDKKKSEHEKAEDTHPLSNIRLNIDLIIACLKAKNVERAREIVNDVAREMSLINEVLRYQKVDTGLDEQQTRELWDLRAAAERAIRSMQEQGDPTEVQEFVQLAKDCISKQRDREAPATKASWPGKFIRLDIDGGSVPFPNFLSKCC
jgi:signal transduction histidine kinase